MTERETTPGSELAFAGVAGQAALIRSGEISARELTENTLRRIERLDSTLNAFVRVLADEALDEATRLDQRQADGHSLGPLHGVPNRDQRRERRRRNADDVQRCGGNPHRLRWTRRSSGGCATPAR